MSSITPQILNAVSPMLIRAAEFDNAGRHPGRTAGHTGGRHRLMTALTDRLVDRFGGTE